MRSSWLSSCVFAAGALALGGCQGVQTPTTEVRLQPTMPANTILLSTVMNDVSQEPGFTDRMMEALGKGSKTGAAVLSPKLVHDMRVTIRGRWWTALDHFPGWSMPDINPVVDLSGVVDKTLAEVEPRSLSDYVDLGEYGLDRSVTADLDKPSTLPGFSTEGIVVPLGNDVVYGDGPNAAIAPMHSESMRLAEVMNRLAYNRLEGAGELTATIGDGAANTPEDLLRALMASGHQVLVADARYFANFGHLHYEGMDVMMPFWVNTQVWMPGEDRQLKVPVSHAEYEWQVRGPKVNADISFYFGIDGKAEFRTMDTLDQAWVLGRHVHEYRGEEAVEVTRLTGLLALAYAHAHLAYPRLPFGGYYAMGVCQDGVSAIERKMTGTTTLFPNTAEMVYFKDSRDAEIDGLLAGVPKDRDGGAPQMTRVFGSLPATDLAAISIPGLAGDLESVQKAWHDGTLRYERGPRWWVVLFRWVEAAVGLVLLWLAMRLMARRLLELRSRRRRARYGR
jgi:hypothetical protein